MKKILLLHTGGTFGMVPMEPDEILAPGNLQNQIDAYIPEIHQLADIDVEILFNEDSSNIGIAEWNKLVAVINEKMDKYDGFVVIHGTDTMVYTACALSFTLRNLKKPVILTGAQRPMARIRSDARQNLIDAVETATNEIGEVLIVFGQQVLRGNRAKKYSISSYDAFSSPNFPLIGEIGLNLKINSRNLFNTNKKYIYIPGFNPSLALIHIHPESDPVLYSNVLSSEKDALLLIGFGAGNVPVKNKSWLHFIQNARRNNKTVFIASNSIHGSVELKLYESGNIVAKAGAIGIKDMTVEAACVKIMKILSYTEETEKIYSEFLTNIAGEINI